MKNAVNILLVLAILGSVMMLLRFIRARFTLHPELSRKIVHVTMGLVVLSFPWLFDRTWPVMVLVIAAVAFLLTIRWHPVLHAYLGPVLGAVPRQSYGEVYFPLGAAALFILARGDAALFCVPILILTLGDAVGALIGLRYGRARFRTDEGFKSAEGSLAFFLVAFLSTHVPLLLFTEVGRAESLLIGFVLGFLVMLAEAVAWRGLDNLFIPLGSFFLLDISRHLPASDLLLRVVMMLALTAFTLITARRTTLSHSAALSAAILGYLVWAIGGWQWLVAPMIAFGAFAELIRRGYNIRAAHDVQAVIRAMAGPMIFLSLAQALQRRELFYLFQLAMAGQLAHMLSSRLCVTGACAVWTGRLLLCALAAWGLMFAPYPWLAVTPSHLLLEMGFAAAITWLAVAVFSLVAAWWPTHGSRALWLREGAVAPLVACLGLIPLAVYYSR